MAWALQERDSKGVDSDTKEGHLIPICNGGGFGEVTAFTAGNLARGEGPRPSADVLPTFQQQAGDQHPCVAFTQNTRDEVREIGGNITGALQAEPGMKKQTYVRTGYAVRRLTPTECARLQGFPDSYLDITYRGKPACDGPKYKALGNSWAVPCVRWIVERINLLEKAEEMRGLQ